MSIRLQLSAGEIEAILQAINPDAFDTSTEEGMKSAARCRHAVLRLNARLERLKRVRVASLKRVEREAQRQ